jgi:TDP-4-keto-6-deoxy-D-glucose transaminase
MNISFNKPYFCGNEIKLIEDTLNRGKISGDKYYTEKVNTFIENKFNCQKALFVTSCTAALELAALLIDLKSGDEVIMPSYTFSSTANAVLLRGAKVVFADIDPNTMNIDPEDIKRKITNKTKSIFIVHYAGISCDMDAIMAIAKQHNLKVIEDAAQGVNAKYKNKYLGTIGNIGCYSFHETKNYVCGEGGAILINNKSLLERAEIIRDCGTDTGKFQRGEIDKYSWVDIGSSYLGADILAAFLYAQFEHLDKINEMRKKVFYYYYEHLKLLDEKKIIHMPFIPDYSSPNYHMFYIILRSEKERKYIIEKLKAVGISAVFHYFPLHLSKMGKILGYKKGDLPITEEYASRLLRLPLYPELEEEKLSFIIKNLYNLLL